MRLFIFALVLGMQPLSAETVSRTVEARQEGAVVRWTPAILELANDTQNSLLVINRTNKPQCFQIQYLSERLMVGPGESRIVDLPAFQHGRFQMGCPGMEAQGGEVVFQ